MRIAEKVREFTKPLVEECGCELWDVIFVREGGQWFLRLLIDKDGGVSINDCEAVSRMVDPVLDEKDPIEQSYIFEVWSAGAERPLKRPSDFQKFIGAKVIVKLYKAKNGKKEFSGTLESFDNGLVTINADGETIKIPEGEYALVRLKADI